MGHTSRTLLITMGLKLNLGALGVALVPLAVVITWVLLFKSLYDEGASFTSVASVALNLACLAIFAGIIIPAREALLALAPSDYPAIRETAQLLAFCHSAIV